jgi:hypothetical protein
MDGKVTVSLLVRAGMGLPDLQRSPPTGWDRKKQRSAGAELRGFVAMLLDVVPGRFIAVADSSLRMAVCDKRLMRHMRIVFLGVVLRCAIAPHARGVPPQRRDARCR